MSTKKWVHSVMLTGALASCSGNETTTPNTLEPAAKVSKSLTPEQELAELNRMVDDLERGLPKFTDLTKHMHKEGLSAEDWKATLPDFKIIKEAMAKKDYALAVQAFKLQPMIDFKNR